MQRTFPERLRAAIAKSGLRREEAAQKAGLSRDTIQKLLAGRREPTAATIAGLARALAISSDSLLGL